MHIKKLKVSNFRSIDLAEISFSPLSLVVGANASGKSNLINVFRFIRDIISDGIDNAIALQGGTTYLSNVRAPKGTPIEIQFVLDLSEEMISHILGRKYFAKVDEICYFFSIQPNKKGNGYAIAEDHLSVISTIYSINSSQKGEDRFISTDVRYTADFHKKNVNSSYQFNAHVDEIASQEIQESYKEDYTFSYFLQFAKPTKKDLLLSNIDMLFPRIFSNNKFIRIFDFDPTELKKASSIASMKSLSENGSNLASVLHEILRKKETKEKLTTLLKQYLPYVNGLSVESNIDKSYSYTINEKYSKRNFHASFLSDGTVSIVALIIALYFESGSGVIILEEPERNIHPKLLSLLLDSAEDVSKKKQVIITTHNPEFLKHARPENVRLLSRNDEGNTVITEPANSLMVKTFMENDLGLDDLFLQNLLGE